MTHDKLLAKIDIWKFQTKGYDDTYEVHGILNALRAVVELHKPVMNKSDGEYIEGLYSCSACADRYPCSTIKAIEKELQ